VSQSARGEKKESAPFSDLKPGLLFFISLMIAPVRKDRLLRHRGRDRAKIQTNCMNLLDNPMNGGPALSSGFQYSFCSVL
jgi:hypothetical protein